MPRHLALFLLSVVLLGSGCARKPTCSRPGQHQHEAYSGVEHTKDCRFVTASNAFEIWDCPFGKLVAPKPPPSTEPAPP